MGYTPVQPDHLLLYAAFLTRRFKAASVRSCLNIIGILHKEFGLPFMACFGNPTFLPVSPTSFDPRKQPTRADFKIFPWSVLITSRWSKTIQFRERVVEIPLSRIPRSPSCPKAAIVNALRFTASGLARALWSVERQLVQVFPFLFCTIILRRSALTLSFSRGTPFAAVGIICLPTRCSHWTDWGSRLLALRHHSHLFNHAFDSLPSFRKHAILRHNPLHPPTLTNTSSTPFLGLDRWLSE